MARNCFFEGWRVIVVVLEMHLNISQASTKTHKNPNE